MALEVVVNQCIAIRPLGLGGLLSEPRLNQQLVDLLYALLCWLLLCRSDALVILCQETLWKALRRQPARPSWKT